MLRNRIIVLTLIIFSAILVYYEQNFITLLLFYSITVLTVFSIIHLLRTYRNLKIVQNVFPLTIEHGTKTEYTLKVFNKSLFPYSKVEVKFLYANSLFLNQLEDFSLSLYPTEHFVYRYQIKGNYRGLYLLGAKKIVVYDILNIFKLNIKIKDTTKLTVLPKVTDIVEVNLRAHYSFSEHSIQSTSTTHNDSTKEIRAFNPGDSLKNIHWKLYAKYDQLMVREKENSSVNKTVIVLDSTPLTSSLEDNIINQDKLLEAFLSVSKKLMLENHQLDILINQAEDILLSHRQYSFDQLYDQVANLAFSKHNYAANCIDDYFEHYFSNKNIHGIDLIVFTLDSTHFRLTELLSTLVASSVNVHLVSTNPTPVKTNGIRLYHLDPNFNVSELTLNNEIGGYYEKN